MKMFVAAMLGIFVSLISTVRAAYTLEPTIILSSSSATSITLTMSQPNNSLPADIYSFSLASTSCPDIEEKSGNISTNSVTVNSLEAGVSYLVTVTAVNTLALLMTNTTHNVSTMEAAPTGIPGVPTASKITATSITLHWTKISCKDRNGVITGYMVHYGPINNPSMTVLLKSTNTSYQFTGLAPLTYHIFSVSGVNEKGSGSFSVKAVFLTNKPKSRANPVGGAVGAVVILVVVGSSFLVIGVCTYKKHRHKKDLLAARCGWENFNASISSGTNTESDKDDNNYKTSAAATHSASLTKIERRSPEPYIPPVFTNKCQIPSEDYLGQVHSNVGDTNISVKDPQPYLAPNLGLLESKTREPQPYLVLKSKSEGNLKVYTDTFGLLESESYTTRDPQPYLISKSKSEGNLNDSLNGLLESESYTSRDLQTCLVPKSKSEGNIEVYYNEDVGLLESESSAIRDPQPYLVPKIKSENDSQYENCMLYYNKNLSLESDGSATGDPQPYLVTKCKSEDNLDVYDNFGPWESESYIVRDPQPYLVPINKLEKNAEVHYSDNLVLLEPESNTTRDPQPYLNPRIKSEDDSQTEKCHTLYYNVHVLSQSDLVPKSDICESSECYNYATRGPWPYLVPKSGSENVSQSESNSNTEIYCSIKHDCTRTYAVTVGSSKISKHSQPYLTPTATVQQKDREKHADTENTIHEHDGTNYEETNPEKILSDGSYSQTQHDLTKAESPQQYLIPVTTSTMRRSIRH